MEVYYAKPGDWTYNCGHKAVVLAVEPYEEYKYAVRRDNRFRPTDKGNGVLVEIHKQGWSPLNNVVPLGHLRGPYAEIAAEVQVRAAKSLEHAKQEQAKRSAKRDRAHAVADRLRAAGYEHHGVHSDGDYIMVTPDVLAAMLDRIEASNP